MGDFVLIEKMIVLCEVMVSDVFGAMIWLQFRSLTQFQIGIIIASLLLQLSFVYYFSTLISLIMFLHACK